MAPAIAPTAWQNAPPLAPASNTSGSAAVEAPPPSNFTGHYTTLPRPVADAVTVTHPGEPVLPPCPECLTPPTQSSRLFDNFSLFVGLDGSKEPLDLGINANFGYRVSVNWGLALLEQSGIGLQVGTAVNYSQNALRLQQFVDGTVDHWQSFTTVGVFQRTAGALRWGVVYDFRFDDYFDRTSAGQWRAQLGWQVNADNEFGVWATIRDHGDSALIGPIPVSVQPISQWNFFWRHIWANEIVTRLWVGLASEHSRFNLLLPPEPSVNHPFTFGADIFVPLTPTLSLFGEAHFITPNDTGTITATLGIAWYPGTTHETARSRFAPMLPLANNATFALDVW